ncbi:unnamed protein product, partial [Didymodactylos carnosus]
NLSRGLDGDEDEFEGENEYNLISKLKPKYERTKLFQINPNENEKLCLGHDNGSHSMDINYVRKKRVPLNNSPALLMAEHTILNEEVDDLYFTTNCSLKMDIYHPICYSIYENQIPFSSREWSLSCLKGIWVGTYSTHGLEFLYLNSITNFVCPTSLGKECLISDKVLENVLIATKITGDPNVPRGEISFVALKQMDNVDSKNNDFIQQRCFQAAGQIAATGFVNPSYIKTKLEVVSNDEILITWYQLYHISRYKRCVF